MMSGTLKPTHPKRTPSQLHPLDPVDARFRDDVRAKFRLHVKRKPPSVRPRRLAVETSFLRPVDDIRFWLRIAAIYLP
jgi:hypothetical protein